MTDLKISELEDGGSSQAADAIPIARSGQNYYVTSQYLKNFVFGSNGTISIAAGKTFSVNNTITLNGNDGVSVNFGSGGTFLYDGGPLGIPSSGTMTNVTGLPLTSGVTGTLPVINGGTGLSTLGTGVATAFGQNVTGSGGIVLATSPTLTTPVLGVASATSINKVTLSQPASGATLTLADGSVLATSGAYSITLTATGTSNVTLPASGTLASSISKLSDFASTTSAELRSVISDETGTGALVFGTNPTITGTATFNGSSSGTVGLKAPAVAGTTTFTLPSSNGTSGYVLVTDGLGNTSWAVSGGAAGSAAGVDKNIQFNDAASMAGAGSFNFDKTTNTVTLGVVSSTTGTFALANSGSAYTASIKSGVNSADWTLTLPTSAGTNNYLLKTDGSGNTAWVNPTALGIDLDVGTTAITGGTPGYILYDNAGALGELATTGSGNVVRATSPTLVTPLLGTPTSGNFSTGTFTWPTFNQNTSGTAASLSATLVTSLGGTGLTGFTAANNAIYSTSASALTAGTLPVAAGGTGTGTAFTAGSVVFAGTSGVYSQANSQLFWDNTNSRLGVGTASPAQSLDLRGSNAVAQLKATGTNGSATLVLDGADSGSYPGVTLRQNGTGFWSLQQRADTNFYLYRESGSGNIIASAGDFLIGTSTDRLRLTVSGPATVSTPTLGTASGNAFICGPDTAYGLMIGQSGTGNPWLQAQRVDGTATAYDIVMQPVGGNVGIGTSSPGARLDVYGGAGAVTTTIRAATGQNAFLSVMGNGNAFLSTSFDIIQDSTNAAQIFQRANAPLLFGTNNTERMRINSGAPILCLSGGNTSATGTGIAFPATQSASSDANTLDDYEEGAWTPTLASGTWNLRNATYTKIGRQVTVELWADTFSSTVNIINGLPFVANSYSPGVAHNNSGNAYVARAGASSTDVYLRNYADAAIALNSMGSFLIFTITYSTT